MERWKQDDLKILEGTTGHPLISKKLMMLERMTVKHQSQSLELSMHRSAMAKKFHDIGEEKGEGKGQPLPRSHFFYLSGRQGDDRKTTDNDKREMGGAVVESSDDLFAITFPEFGDPRREIGGVHLYASRPHLV